MLPEAPESAMFLVESPTLRLESAAHSIQVIHSRLLSDNCPVSDNGNIQNI
jgi:uncharacterized protein Usg